MRTLTAERELGPDHPAARAARVHRTLAEGLVTTAAIALLSAVAFAFGVGGRPALPGSLAAVAAFAIATTIARTLRREQTTALLARGEWSSAPYVDRECERLTGRRHRLRLASELYRLLSDARQPGRITLSARPRAGIHQIRHVSGELEAIIDALRDDAPVRVQTMAICDRLLAGGYDSLLYRGEIAELRQMLARIRCGLILSPREESRRPPHLRE
jgi:hypothetical protein